MVATILDRVSEASSSLTSIRKGQCADALTKEDSGRGTEAARLWSRAAIYASLIHRVAATDRDQIVNLTFVAPAIRDARFTYAIA